MKPKKEFGTVYVIIFPNGMIYVGQTTKTLDKRLWRHILDAFNETRTSYNSRYCIDIRKYCNNSLIVIKPLEENVQKSLLRKRERDWIWALHANDPLIGYNKQDGRKVSDVNAYQRANYKPRSEMTPEELEEARRIAGERTKAKKATMTDEEIAEARRKHNESAAKSRAKKKATMTDEEIAEARRKHNEVCAKSRAKKKASMTEDDLVEFRRERAEYERNRVVAKKAAKLEAEGQTTLP